MEFDIRNKHFALFRHFYCTRVLRHQVQIWTNQPKTSLRRSNCCFKHFVKFVLTNCFRNILQYFGKISEKITTICVVWLEKLTTEYLWSWFLHSVLIYFGSLNTFTTLCSTPLKQKLNASIFILFLFQCRFFWQKCHLFLVSICVSSAQDACYFDQRHTVKRRKQETFSSHTIFRRSYAEHGSN